MILARRTQGENRIAIARPYRRALCASGLLMFGATLSPAYAGDVFALSGGAQARVSVQSMAERKFATIVPQQYDFSCGSAALATLLTHHYARDTSEAAAFKAMWAVGDQDRIRKLGFSLFEMKAYLESVGLKADGFRLTLDRIQEIGVPGIGLIDVKGYKHFVVIKGITDKTVLYGDPSRGLVMQDRKKFEEIWDGIVLFIRSDVQTGKANFNSHKDWRLTPTGPIDRAFDRETLQQTTLAQTRSYFSGFAISVPERN